MTDGKLTSKQEQFLADVLAGARAVDDPDVVDERRDVRFAAQMDSLLEAQRKLGGAAEVLERDLADSNREPEPFPGADELIRSTVAEQVSPHPRRRTVIGVALAAGLLAALSVWWWWPDDDVPRNQWLEGTIPCDSPVGSLQAFDQFTWRFELPADGYFVVVVFDQRDLATEVTRSARLDAPRWQPEEQLPRSIRWRVTAYDEFGNELGFGWAEAER